jgi:hypothetical protein
MALAPTVPYLTPPSRIVNEALDVLGKSEKIIGDIADGTPIAETARRNYGQALRQLLRTSHWPFARKRAKLTLLGDATGQSALPIIPYVEHPWAYAYAWPIDGVQGRWLPWNGDTAQPLNAQGIPLTTGVSALARAPSVPGRFLVSSSDQYPVVVGSADWSQMPDLQRTEGVGPTSRKIVLTDCANAEFVYTRFVPVIEEWDDGFRQAMVMMMAMKLAPVVVSDVRERQAELNRLTANLKNTIADARLQAGNEAGYPMTTDHTPDWITARNRGAGGWGGGGHLGFGLGATSGYLGCGFESMSWGGSVF